MSDSIIITIVNDSDEGMADELLRPYAPPPGGFPLIQGIEEVDDSPLTGPIFSAEGDESGPIELFCPGGDTPGRGPITITIEPRNAFGDGRHATTWLCLRFLLELLGGIPREDRPGLSLLDAGTGSGVLAITASRLGVGHIDAVEVNPHAAECAAHNIGENGCGTIKLHQSYIASFNPGRTYDIILANLVTDVIIGSLDALVALIGAGGTLIASGVSVGRDELVMQSFLSKGLRLLDHARHDGWCGYVMRKG
ncbi:MAG: 50S ribosomal protein L11 methyltransferase [Spirochaetes bacterium]|nr:50S ribosomal protein L11 methyltransferase [Spirochaetota bacterium]